MTEGNIEQEVNELLRLEEFEVVGHALSTEQVVDFRIKVNELSLKQELRLGVSPEVAYDIGMRILECASAVGAGTDYKKLHRDRWQGSGKNRDLT